MLRLEQQQLHLQMGCCHSTCTALEPKVGTVTPLNQRQFEPERARLACSGSKRVQCRVAIVSLCLHELQVAALLTLQPC